MKKKTEELFKNFRSEIEAYSKAENSKILKYETICDELENLLGDRVEKVLLNPETFNKVFHLKYDEVDVKIEIKY